MQKRRVLVCVLCGSERGDWLNPRLVSVLLMLQRDERFVVTISMVENRRPHHHARNVAVDRARSGNFDFLIQLDNDNVPPLDLLDILSDADASGKSIVALSYAVHFDSGWQIIPQDNGPKDGAFRQSGCLPAGVLMIKRDVWQQLKGPWFLWLSNEDELGSQKIGEDYFFCEKATAAGFKVWTHNSVVVPHLKTIDATAMCRGAAR
jgi:GT2 family glycosyltransferase